MMAYLGLSPEPNYPDQYFTSPGERLTCGDYCNQGQSATMIYLARPEGCTCPGEAAVKREQSPMTLYVIGAIAAYLLLMR